MHTYNKLLFYYYSFLQVQLCSSSKDLASLQESLQSYSESAPSLSRIHAGLLVLSCSSDEQWYRSILLDTVNLRQDGENLIEVGVVTYHGNMVV